MMQRFALVLILALAFTRSFAAAPAGFIALFLSLIHI